MENSKIVCPVCSGTCSSLAPVDFNKSCEEPRGKILEPSGIPIVYALCGRCGFCFAPEISQWALDEFSEKIYNDRYVLVDPDFVEVRPKANAAKLIATFGRFSDAIRHLDYGGGTGTLVEILRQSGWNSVSYDPFVNRDMAPNALGQFDLITAFEVFEHVPDIRELMSDLRSLLSPNGLVLFSTLLSDGNIQRDQPLTWWYASPRNGHISLFSRTSLALVAQNSGFNFGSFSQVLHAFFTKVPPWAAHIIRTE